MWTLYDAILDSLPRGNALTCVDQGPNWTLAESDLGCGLAMTTEGSTRDPAFPDFTGLSLAQAAPRIKSWNLPEASRAMAAINSCYNTPERLARLGCAEPFDNYCTRGLDFTGKTIGVVGHMKMPAHLLAAAKQVWILERHPQPGDYPDSACEDLLPQCEIVLITGSSLVNKTLPRLLQLCKDACTIVTGPTVPLCPALLDCGIDRLAGMVVTRPGDLKRKLAARLPFTPYPFGETFLLKRDHL